MTTRGSPHCIAAIGVTIASLLVALAPVAAQPPVTRLVGTVTGPADIPLAGVSVVLTAEDGQSFVEVTGPAGEFSFSNVPPGKVQLYAYQPGYQDFKSEPFFIAAGGERRFDISLWLTPITETVEVEAKISNGPRNEPVEPNEVGPEELAALPLPTDRFQEVFPLLPGVVRDPEGRLSFNGARPSESTLLVNGTNVTDPLTGEFAVQLPLKAIETVQVHSLPYSAKYGQVTAAVAEIGTRGGGNEWDIDFGDLFPKPRFRDGKIKGLKSFVPEVRVSGPLEKEKAWISLGFGYRFLRTRIYDVEEGADERIFESFDTFIQTDYRYKENHRLIGTFSYFPMEEDNLGLGALQPESATPNFDNWGWHAALSERSILGRTIVESTLAVKTFDVAVRPKSSDVARLTPEGLRDNYFNELNRESTRIELGSAVTHAPRDWFGTHLLEIGGGVAYTSFSGSDLGLPVEVFDASGRLTRRIDFVGDPSIGGSDVQASGYVQDQWRPTERLGIDLGVRYDYDRLVGEHQLAPRIAGAWVLDESGRTAVKAGWGLFYDHVFLHFDSFERYQTRIETEYGVDGQPLGLPLVFRPRLAEEDIEVPRSTMWNVELDRSLLESVQLRVNYRARAGSKQMIVDRVENGTDGALLLSSRGKSSLRELDITARIERGENEMFLSYVRSQSTGDLNNFGTLYQNLRSPLLYANENSLLDLDVTNRFLFWGVWKLKWDIILAPGIEWRTGFPYTVLDTDYSPSGVRNKGGRYPSFLSADLRVTKGIRVKGRKVRVGFQIFNLFGHFNPREVVAHQASPRFGSFLNSPDMGIGFRLSVGH